MNLPLHPALRIRLARGESAREAARSAGVSRDTLRRVEHGEAITRADVLRRLADHYGVAPGDLLAEEAQAA